MSAVTVPPESKSIDKVLALAKPGDVILLTPCDPKFDLAKPTLPLAKLIREATRAPVSHALVVIEDGYFVDIRASRDVPVAKALVSSLGEMKSLRGCWLLRHDHSSAPDTGEFERSIVASADVVLRSATKIEFGKSELLSGLLLLLVRRDGPKIIAKLGLREALKSLLDASPDRMFCSELTYRIFAGAAAATDEKEYGIDCSDMLLKEWFALLAGGLHIEPPTLTVQAGSPIARLASQGALVDFPWAIREVEAPEGTESELPSDAELEKDVADLLTKLKTASSSDDWRGEIADFVTPRDLLYSPSLTPIARWGLGLEEKLDPWRCP